MTQTANPADDAARRVKDEMDLHAVTGDSGWAVFHLSDGRPFDHVAYPSWQDAVKATKWDRDNYMYPEIPPDGMPSLREAQGILDYARLIHRMGHRIPGDDWKDHQAASMPMQPWDRRLMAYQLAKGKPLDIRGYSNLPMERLARNG